ncbi:hypothetical protein [Mesorhizobium sp. A556]
MNELIHVPTSICRRMLNKAQEIDMQAKCLSPLLKSTMPLPASDRK